MMGLDRGQGVTDVRTTNRSSLVRPVFAKQYETIVRGNGPYLFTADGRRYLDGSSGAMTANLGHALPEIADIMAEQARRIAFTFRNQFTNEPAERLASKLASLAPGDLDNVFFVNSGSEASEYAIRVALHYWRHRGVPSKTKIIGRSTSYHGMTMGAISLSGHATRRPDYGTLLHDFARVPAAYCYRCSFDKQPQTCALECARAWEGEIEGLGSDTIAAVIAEPIVGAAGGVLPAPPGYFRLLRDICTRHDILLIADEVITGMGRTGNWFASEYEQIVPDMILTAKGLSAGYTPMAAVLLRSQILDDVRAAGATAMPFGHTFSGNPLSAAICLGVVEHIERNKILDNVRELGPRLGVGLNALAQRYATMVDVRGRGLLWGFEFVEDRASRNPRSGVSARFVELCLEEGLLVYASGIPPLDNSIIVAPPLNIQPEHVEEILGSMDRALSRLAGTCPSGRSAA